jgi:hypothetical protein
LISGGVWYALSEVMFIYSAPFIAMYKLYPLHS